MFVGSCKKEDPTEPSNNSTTNTTTTQPPPTNNPYDDYWGCWRESTGNPGYYDIILVEDTIGPHELYFGTLCVADSMLFLDVGVFRNDTLILDNGTYEFWCFIENDTLLYSAYVPNATTEKYIKI